MSLQTLCRDAAASACPVPLIYPVPLFAAAMFVRWSYAYIHVINVERSGFDLLGAKAKARAEAGMRAARLLWAAAIIGVDYTSYELEKVC